MNHITQNERECGVASLAMVTGEDIGTCRHLLLKHGWNYDYGVTPVQLIFALYDLKFSFQYSCGEKFLENKDLTKGVYILSVPSLTQKGFHYIVLNNGDVLDPQKGNVDTFYSSLSQINTIEDSIEVK